MTRAWVDVVGVGEEGWDGLSEAARTAVSGAEVVIGSERHHRLVPEASGERIVWPSPFNMMVKRIAGYRGRRVAVLVTGDPLWYSAGAKLAAALPKGSIVFHPHLSAFQLACARMGWSLADVETLTVHGRPVGQAVPYFSPGARLVILGEDSDTPAEIARRLTDLGFGPSEMTVFDAMGGPREARHEGIAHDWSSSVSDFHTLCLSCRAADDAEPLPLTGLPDAAFEHDGQITKREIRTLTLAALEPRRGAILWDIGAGCGSVGIEWMRAARDAMTHAVEPDQRRREMALRNADRLGAPRLNLIAGRAPEALGDLPQPDAIFLGGGLGEETARRCHAALPRHGRLVANAVTLDSEALLGRLRAELGGKLARVSVARAEPVGHRTGWRPAMPVTQWSLKR